MYMDAHNCPKNGCVCTTHLCTCVSGVLMHFSVTKKFIHLCSVCVSCVWRLPLVFSLSKYMHPLVLGVFFLSFFVKSSSVMQR